MIVLRRLSFFLALHAFGMRAKPRAVRFVEVLGGVLSLLEEGNKILSY